MEPKGRPFPHLPDLWDYQKERSPEVVALLEKEASLKKIYDRPSNNKRKKSKRTKPRKKNPQPKMKDLFPIKVNEDGFPMKHCKYEPLEGWFVYRPPGYGCKKPTTRGNNKSAGAIAGHCTSCHLKPCITKEFHNDSTDLWLDMSIKLLKPDAECSASVAEFLTKKHCQLFKWRYRKNLKSPRCITQYLLDWYSVPNSQGDSSVDDEDDLPLSSLRDRQIGDQPLVAPTASFTHASAMEARCDSDSEDDLSHLPVISWGHPLPNRVSLDTTQGSGNATGNCSPHVASLQSQSSDSDSENEF